MFFFLICTSRYQYDIGGVTPHGATVPASALAYKASLIRLLLMSPQLELSSFKCFHYQAAIKRLHEPFYAWLVQTMYLAVNQSK